MKKIFLLLFLLTCLLSFNFANAGVNETGSSSISLECKKTLLKKYQSDLSVSKSEGKNFLMYASVTENDCVWYQTWPKKEVSKKDHKYAFKKCTKEAKKNKLKTDCFIFAVNDKIVWKNIDKQAVLASKDAPLEKKISYLNERFEFRYNIHENLPKKWVTEFNNIMDVLQEVLPIQDNMNDYLKSPRMDIYAWKSTKNPFPEVKNNMKGSCICGDDSTTWMQLEIPSEELAKKYIHRYSVIAHEYFHVYQITLSENKLSDRDSPKWLTEGGAKVFEEMYVNQYYGKDSLKNDLKRTEMWSKKVLKKPILYEKHKTSNKRGMDGNYTGSAFMVLVLVNELEKNNISEQQAFQLVFRNFWIERAKHRKWEKAFEQTFEMSAEEFYERLSKYKRKDLKKILPSKTLTIQNIFS